MVCRAIVLLSIAVAAYAAAANEPIAILSQSQDISPDGSWKLQYETANGISVSEQGVLKNAGQKDAEAEEVHGSASWTAPDGQKMSLTWVANENGANFQGDHLPTPPPTPEVPILIQRALDWIKAHPSTDKENKF